MNGYTIPVCRGQTGLTGKTSAPASPFLKRKQKKSAQWIFFSLAVYLSQHRGVIAGLRFRRFERVRQVRFICKVRLKKKPAFV